MARVTPLTSATWNVYIKAQVDALPDQSMTARRLFKRNLKLEKIAQVERLARGSNTATNFRSNNIYVPPGTRSPAPHSPWSNLTFAYQDDLSKSQTIFGQTAVGQIVWSPELGLFVAISRSVKCATSPDGVTWTLRPGFTTARAVSNSEIHSMIWNGQQFLGVDDTGAAVRSLDGINWTSNRITDSTNSVLALSLYAVCWSSTLGKFLAVGYPGQCWTSPDGIVWNQNSDNNLSSATSGANMRAVVWSPELNIFVAIGGSAGNNGRAATSPDGITWTNRTSYNSVMSIVNNIFPMAIDWNGSQFLAVARSANSSPPARCATSSDGITWAARIGLGSVLGSSNFPRQLARLGSIYAVTAVGGRIARSTNGGVTWTTQTSSMTVLGPTGNTVIAANSSQFVAGSALGKIATSADGATWTYQDDLSKSLTIFGLSTALSVVWTGSKYLTVGIDGRCASSPDGKTWTYHPDLAAKFGPQNEALAVNWNGQQFLAVGGSAAASGGGICATSPDGITWTVRASYATRVGNPYDGVNRSNIAWSGTRYVVTVAAFQASATSDSIILTSVDGITWTISDSSLSSSRWTPYIIWNGSLFCLSGGGDNGDNSIYRTIATSANGIDWTDRYDPNTAQSMTPGQVAWNGSVFVIPEKDGTRYLTSANGTTWTLQTGLPFVPGYIRSFGSQFVIGDSNGYLATSADNGSTWTYRGQQSIFSQDLLYNTTTSNFIAVGGSGAVWTSQ